MPPSNAQVPATTSAKSPSPPTSRWTERLTLFLLLLSITACTGKPLPEGFVVLVENTPQSLDPRFASDDIGVKISKLVFAPLLTFTTPNAEPELILAQSLEQASPIRYNLTLKPNLTFHDGSPLTTEDVRFTFASIPWMQEKLERIEIHSATRLSFHLTEPYAPFLFDMSVGIVSARELAGTEDDPRSKQATLGAGAFMLKERRGRDIVILERFDDFTLGRPELPRIIFRAIRDDNARIIAMLGGSADLAVNNISPLMLPVVQDDRSLRVESFESIKYTYMMFNTRVKPLDDVRVRKAIALAIDRDEIIEFKFRGLATPATGMLAANHWAYAPDLPIYHRDVDAARALLDEAGYPDPPGDAPRFSLVYRTSSSKFRKAITELIAAQLGDIGIDVTVEAMEFGTYYGLITGGNFELASLQWVDPTEPDLMYLAHHSSQVPYENDKKQGRNRGAYKNPELDRLLEDARRAPDRDTRRELYQKAQHILARELPYVPLWHERNIAVMKDRVEGFQIMPNARLRMLERTRVD